MKTWAYLSSVLIFYFTYGLYISQFDDKVNQSGFSLSTPNNFYDYKGVINVHTNRSLGSSPAEVILRAATQADLDFIIFTDLNDLEGSDNYDYYYGRTLVLSGTKINYLDARFIHYSPRERVLGSNLAAAQLRLADLLSSDAWVNRDKLLILVHPFMEGFEWKGDIPPGVDGIEQINIKALALLKWSEDRISSIWSVLTYPFNSQLAFIRLFTEPSREITLVDEESQRRPFWAFSGAEASARAIPFSNSVIKFPSYQKHFEMFSNHVLLDSELTGSLEKDRQKIFSALKNGAFYIAFDAIGEATGFEAWVDCSGQIFPIGSQIKLRDDCKLISRLPGELKFFFEQVVYKNAVRHFTTNSAYFELPLKEPGAYRIQVRVSPYLPLPDAKKWITWIYTNHFRISL
ncbi:MAG: hypothetical protein N2578_02160 [Bdellovibrionaceae bacterium]|nr:hypothetical protein [Pseudobdellovibrionaceae bacterium]